MWYTSEPNNSKFYVRDNLYSEIQKFTVENLKKKDNNKIILICGDTGSGKSAFAFQIGSVCDSNFTLKNIQFTTNETIQGLKTLHNQVIIFDEAFRGASGRNTMNKEQKQLLQMLYEIRQLNQAVFLVSPSFFRLDEAIAVELSDAMFYIYKLKNGQRGFRMFNNNKKNRLYYAAKKGRKSYSLIKTLFNGTFPETYVVNETEYRKKKFESLFMTKKEEKKDKTKEKYKEERKILYETIVDQAGSYGNASKVLEKKGLSITKQSIHRRVAPNTDLS